MFANVINRPGDFVGPNFFNESVVVFVVMPVILGCMLMNYFVLKSVMTKLQPPKGSAVGKKLSQEMRLARKLLLYSFIIQAAAIAFLLLAYVNL